MRLPVPNLPIVLNDKTYIELECKTLTGLIKHGLIKHEFYNNT